MKIVLKVAALGLVLALSPGQPVLAATFAYVANQLSDNVSVINTATNVVDTTVAVDNQPIGVAITPNGAFAYIANTGSDSISVINTATNSVDATVAVGSLPFGVAITPDGGAAYVPNAGSDNVSVIDTATNVVMATVAVGNGPIGVAISPDGAFAYVVNRDSDNVSLINTATKAVDVTIAVGLLPVAVAITPNGAFAYVTNAGADNVSVVNTATNAIVATVAVGDGPLAVAITPDGAFAYVANTGADSVSVINTATKAVDAMVAVGDRPIGVAITPDGAFAYVTNSGSGSVSTINTLTNVVDAIVAVGNGPNGVAITPPSDRDGDGIEDGIDGTFNGVFADQSKVFSNDFTDQHLGGTTLGTIVARSDNDVTVTDNSTDGVVLAANGGVGISLVQMCGPANTDIFSVFLTAGDVTSQACGSLTAEVLSGPVTVSIGVNIDVIIPAGARAFMEQLPGSLVSIANLSGTGGPDIVVEEDGVPVAVGPDDPPLIANVDDGAPDAPDDVTGRAKRGKANLTWTPVDEVESYDVYRTLQSGGPYALVGSIDRNVFVDTAVITGETYYYVVQSVAGGNNSANSNEAEVLVPAGRRRR